MSLPYASNISRICDHGDKTMRTVHDPGLRALLSILGTTLGRPMDMDLACVDWEKVILAGSRQRLQYALYPILVSQGWLDAMPKGWREHLHSDYWDNLVRTERMFRKWCQLQKVLQQAEIPFLVVNGSADCVLLYHGDLAQDESKDIDLVIPAAHFGRFLDVTSQLGATRLKRLLFKGKVEMPFLDWDRLVPGGASCPWDIEWQGVILDPKDYFMPFPGLEEKRIDPFEDPLVVKCNDTQIVTLKLSLQVLLHSCHYVSHWDRRLVLLYKLAKLCHLYREEIEWSEIASYRDKWFAPLLLNVFETCQRYFPLQIPCDVLESLGKRNGSRLLRRVRLGLVSDKTEEACGNYYWLGVFYLLAANRLSQRARFLMNMVVPPIESLLPSHRRRPVYLRYWINMVRTLILTIAHYLLAWWGGGNCICIANDIYSLW